MIGWWFCKIAGHRYSRFGAMVDGCLRCGHYPYPRDPKQPEDSSAPGETL